MEIGRSLSSVRSADALRYVDSNVAELDARKVCRVLMSGRVHEMDQCPSAPSIDTDNTEIGRLRIIYPMPARRDRVPGPDRAGHASHDAG
jgi:hypothetical protein